MSENIMSASRSERKIEILHTDRSLLLYSIMLFPESFARNRVKEFLMKNMYLWPSQEGYWGSFDHYEKGRDGLLTSATLNLEQFYQRFGRKKEFFKPGSVILDIGSGVGSAVEDISKHYSKVKAVGLDLRYGKEKAAGSRGLHIKGSWKALPFADNSFNRILACESFPAWWSHHDLALLKTVIKEVTRVSQVGTIWRATINPANQKALIESMIESGWDVSIHSWRPLMVARLKEK